MNKLKKYQTQNTQPLQTQPPRQKQPNSPTQPNNNPNPNPNINQKQKQSFIKVIIKSGDTQKKNQSFYYDCKDHQSNSTNEQLQKYTTDLLKLIQIQDYKTKNNKNQINQLMKGIAHDEAVIGRIKEIYGDGSKPFQKILGEIDQYLGEYQGEEEE